MNFRTAEFSLRKVKNPKALVVFIPGSGQDGRFMPNLPSLRKWADEHKCATIGCHFEDINPQNIEGYADAKGGSGQALLDYIAKYNLEHLPIFTWGFSAGGQFSYEFACFVPNRVAGFVVNKGGFYYTALAPPETRKIPAIFFTGNKDAMFRQYIICGLYLMNKRDEQCKWELVQEEVDHVPGDSLKLGLELFEKVLAK